jgi:hypothetical protein
MDFDVQRFKTICKECKTPAAMPGFCFRMAGAAQCTDARCNVTLKKTLQARWDIPAMHTLCKYTMVCVDNFKKYFAARVANRTDSSPFRSPE